LTEDRQQQEDMTHFEFTQRNAFDKQELVAYANGTLLDDGPSEMGRLPSPPMLMFDRVVDVRHDGSRGLIVAEQDIALDAWYFWCHFSNEKDIFTSLFPSSSK
jgi:3-hydroxyacyl-[acyl-carrier protein] dehydratase / trans-2-decenoyl-[acyl-carrier protein] isomerase